MGTLRPSAAKPREAGRAGDLLDVGKATGNPNNPGAGAAATGGRAGRKPIPGRGAPGHLPGLQPGTRRACRSPCPGRRPLPQPPGRYRGCLPPPARRMSEGPAGKEAPRCEAARRDTPLAPEAWPRRPGTSRAQQTAFGRRAEALGTPEGSPEGPSREDAPSPGRGPPRQRPGPGRSPSASRRAGPPAAPGRRARQLPRRRGAGFANRRSPRRKVPRWRRAAGTPHYLPRGPSKGFGGVDTTAGSGPPPGLTSFLCFGRNYACSREVEEESLSLGAAHSSKGRSDHTPRGGAGRGSAGRRGRGGDGPQAASAPAAAAARPGQSRAPGRAVCVVSLHFQPGGGKTSTKRGPSRINARRPSWRPRTGGGGRLPASAAGGARRSSGTGPGRGETGREQKCGGKAR